MTRRSIGAVVAVLAGVSPIAGCGAGSGTASTSTSIATAEVAASVAAPATTVATVATAPASDVTIAKAGISSAKAPGSRAAPKPQAAPGRAPAARHDLTGAAAQHAKRSAGQMPSKASPPPGAGKVMGSKPSHLGGLRSQGATACKQLAAPKRRLTAKRRARLKALCAKLYR